MLNILLIVIDTYTIGNNYAPNHWYLSIALPIVVCAYLALNILLSARFLKINKLLKTSTVLRLTNAFIYIPPLFIKTRNPYAQKELNQINIFKADFSSWLPEATLENNIHCIIALTLFALATTFLIFGLIKQIKNK